MNQLDKHLEVTGCLKEPVVACTQPQGLKKQPKLFHLSDLIEISFFRTKKK